MRHILNVYGKEVRQRLAAANAPRERLEVIIRTSFSEQNFRPEVVNAWLNFYVFAQKSGEVARLLEVYHRRLESNLRHELRKLLPGCAEFVAEGIAAMIDGAYIRRVLRRDGGIPCSPEDMALDYLDLCLNRSGAGS